MRASEMTQRAKVFASKAGTQTVEGESQGVPDFTVWSGHLYTHTCLCTHISSHTEKKLIHVIKI